MAAYSEFWKSLVQCLIKWQGLGCFMIWVGILPRREVCWWFVFPLCLSDRVLIKMSIFSYSHLVFFWAGYPVKWNPDAFTPTYYIAEQIIYGREGKIKLLLRVLWHISLITSKTPLLPLNIYQDSALGRGAVWCNKFDSVQCHWLAIRRT